MKTQLPQNYTIAQVVSVSFEGRQAVVAQLVVGEVVRLVRDPQNPFDRNAIKVENSSGCQFGFLSQDLAAMLSDSFVKYGQPVLARVEAILGGYSEWSNLGVRIRFQPPGPNEGK